MANKCTGASSIYNDLPDCPGKKSMPGLMLKAYYASKRDILKFPALKEAPTSMKEAAILDGEFTLAADKTFIYIGVVSDKNNVKSETQGEFGSKTMKNSVELHLRGTDEEVTGLVNQLLNDDGVLVVETRNKKFRVVGNEHFNTVFSLSQDSGTAVTDTNETVVTAEATDFGAAPFYVGKIKTSEGTLDCATGELTAAA